MKTVLLLLMLLLPFMPEAQKKAALFNMSLHQPEAAEMYTGVDNMIVFRGPVTGKYFRMERSGGPLLMRSGTTLQTTLRYEQEGTDTLWVFEDEELLLEKIYKIHSSMPLQAAVRGLNDSIITSAGMIAAGRLEVRMPGTLYKPPHKIASYRITLQDPSGREIRSFRVEGAAFPPEFSEALKPQTSGSRVLFSQITLFEQSGHSKPSQNLILPNLRITLRNL